MLTAKENMIECMKGGNPDRYVNQFEAIKFLFPPQTIFGPPLPECGGPDTVNAWGVTNSWPEGTPGTFPVHTPDKIVVKDIEHWSDYVHAPSNDFTEEQWGICRQMFDEVDGRKAFKACFIAPGIFEQTHNLCEIVRVLTYYIEYENEMHDIIKVLTDYEMEMAEGICKYLKPDMIFHHDDWGSLDSTFMSVPMFEDFLLEPYKLIYGYYHDHGVDYIVHHSDSYAATLVPDMIEMGINVFQGCMETNNVGDLLKKYGTQITYMGCLENRQVDFDGWTDENCNAVARRVCEQYGMKNFIPCIAQGGPGSVYKGVYQSLTDAIDRLNIEEFDVDDPASARLPIQIMF